MQEERQEEWVATKEGIEAGVGAEAGAGAEVKGAEEGREEDFIRLNKRHSWDCTRRDRVKTEAGTALWHPYHSFGTKVSVTVTTSAREVAVAVAVAAEAVAHLERSSTRKRLWSPWIKFQSVSTLRIHPHIMGRH